MTAKKHLSLCGRCLGTGRYDRGTCFRCRGAGSVAVSRKPAVRFEVSAVYSDGVRRVLKMKAAKSEQAAIDFVLAWGPWPGFDLETIRARSMMCAPI
jgi:DnaJ-class molecular chaperone